MPGVRQSSPHLEVFRRQTGVFEELRQGVQHLNNHIDALVAKNLPTWGVLSWVVVPDPASNRVLTSAMLAGTLFAGANLPLVNPTGKMIEPPIDLITLTAHGHAANLSDAMRHVERLTRSIEAELGPQFETPPQPRDELTVRIRPGEAAQR
jgi:hypothetical protein